MPAYNEFAYKNTLLRVQVQSVAQCVSIWCCKIATSNLAKNEILVIIYAYVKRLTQFFKNSKWRKPYKNTFLWVSDLANADIDRPFVVCFYMVKRSTGCKRSSGGQVIVGAKGVRFPDADAI